MCALIDIFVSANITMTMIQINKNLQLVILKYQLE